MFRRLQNLDYTVVRSITAIHRPAYDKVMVFFTRAGMGALIWWVAFVLPFVISRRYREVSAIMTAALGFNYLSGEQIIKRLVGRIRPSNMIDDDEMKISKPKDHSFPSGHTASSFCAFMVTLLCCSPLIWVPALVLACLISFSRLYLRVHYLTDVLGGMMLGLFNGALTVFVFTRFIFVSTV